MHFTTPDQHNMGYLIRKMKQVEINPTLPVWQ